MFNFRFIWQKKSSSLVSDIAPVEHSTFIIWKRNFGRMYTQPNGNCSTASSRSTRQYFTHQSSSWLAEAFNSVSIINRNGKTVRHQRLLAHNYTYCTLYYFTFQCVDTNHYWNNDGLYKYTKAASQINNFSFSFLVLLQFSFVI